MLSLSRGPLAASLLFACLAPLGVASAAEKGADRPAGAARGSGEGEKDLDVRSGDKALRLMMETNDLTPIRRRAMEVGPAELRKERSRLLTLRKSARFATEAAASTWTSLGPTYRPISGGSAFNAGDNSGLATDVKVHPTDPKTIYVGTGGGGVWKTTDGGSTWIPLTDDLGQLPVGAIAIATSRPQRVYAALGIGDDYSSWYEAGVGLGVIISDDAGATWRVSKAGTSIGIGFYALDVDPRNENVVLAASNTGVWRSTDGGDSWTRVVAVDAKSLSRCLSSPDVVYAGTNVFNLSANPVVQVPGSVWRSADGGATWVEKGTGLPGTATTRARSEVAVSPTDPNRVYALFSDKDDSTLDVAVSDDGGGTWSARNIGSVSPILGSFGNSFIDMAVDPASRDTVYAGGLDQWKSTDAGKTWKRLTEWGGVRYSLPYLHADQHAIAFGPDGAIYYATDGGLFRTADKGLTFTSLNRGLVTLQFYSICQSQTNPNVMLGGNQDNGTSVRLSGTEWKEVVGGDGFGCLVHPGDPNMLHATVYNELVFRSTDGGFSFTQVTSGLSDAGSETNGVFITVLRRNPAIPDTIYTYSLKKLWVSSNNGTQWTTKTTSPPSGLNNFRAIDVLPTDGSRILFGANAGQIYETLDEGATVTKIGSVPVASLQAVRYDRRSVRTIWAASATTTPGLERVWRSTDGGASWTQVSSVGTATGLPDVPVFTIEQDPWNLDVWWAGTFVGLYRSPDNGKSWFRHGFGLPNVIVTDVGFYLNDKKVRVATFGRGIWEALAIPTPTPTATATILFPTVDTSVVAGLSVSLLGGTVGADPSGFGFTWDFADGTSGEGQQVSHAFSTPATRKVVLTAASSGGSSQATRTLTVVPNGGGYGPGGEARLSQERVAVTVSYRNIYTNVVAAGTPLVQADELAFFYFTDPQNPEVFVKVLDFGAQQPYLCFYGGLTNYEYTVTFTVLATGKSLSFVTPADSFKGGADTTSLPHAPAVATGLLARDGSSFEPAPVPGALGPGAAARAVPGAAAPAASPSPSADPQELLLQGGKVGVKVTWRNQYDSSTGPGIPIPKQDAYGYFYFSVLTNAELFVKVLDFGVEKPYLLFWAGLTNFEYTITFRNTTTGATWKTTKAAGTYDGGANTTDLLH